MLMNLEYSSVLVQMSPDWPEIVWNTMFELLQLYSKKTYQLEFSCLDQNLWDTELESLTTVLIHVHSSM